MQELLPAKLHKIGVHGLGKHVLIILSDQISTEKMPFKDSIHSKWKVNYLYHDLAESYDITCKKLVSSLNYYHYADCIIFDFPSFLVFLDNIERISQANEVINKIIVFNPFSKDLSVKSKIINFLKNKTYINLYGHKVNIPDNLMKKYSNMIDKLNFLHVKSAVVIGFENKKAALKLAARIKNSRFEVCEDYSGASALLIDEFR